MANYIVPELDVDDRDLYDYAWLKDSKGYLYTRQAGKGIRLHQVIAYRIQHPEDLNPGLKLTSNDVRVGHRDGYKKNNRRENIQIRTYSEVFKQMRRRHTSQFFGVHWSNTYDKWISKVYYVDADGRHQKQHIGYFPLEQELEAAKARDAWILAHPELFPNPTLNFPEKVAV